MSGGSDEDEYRPLSGKPYFDIIVSKTHVKPHYSMFLPVKMHPVLPQEVKPAVLTYKGEKWDVTYHGNTKRFGKGWRGFIEDNNLKVGDACVFELMESKTTQLIFRTQILRGDLPEELMNKISGETADKPIVIE